MLIERSAFYKDLSTTDPSMAEAWVASIRTSTWDAKRTHQMIHQIRETRNAVHPTQIMTSNAKQSADQFVMTIWRGLRLLALLNEMLSIRSSLTDY
jgi:predicted nucleic acid-binding protein